MTIHPLFYYSQEHRIVICKPCQACISGADLVVHHVRDTHKMTGKDFQGAQLYLNSLELQTPKELAEMPHTISSPIPYLKILAGWGCNLCQFGTTNYDAGRKHLRKVHNTSVRTSGNLLRRVQLQRLLNKAQSRKYIEVQSAQLQSSQDESPVISQLLESAAKQAAAFISLPNVSTTKILGPEQHSQIESIPWLNAFGFSKHLEGLTPASIKRTTSCKILQDDHPHLRDILDGVKIILTSTLDTCREGSKRQVSLPMLRRMQNFGPGMAESCKLHIFRVDKERSTYDKYFAYWQSIIAMTIRVYCGTSTLERQLSWMSALECYDINLLLESPEDTEILHSIMFKIISQSTYPDQFSTPLTSYAAMLAMDTCEGHWRPASNVSGPYSGLIYGGQLICLRQSYKDARQDGSKQMLAMDAIFSVYMHQEQNMPFGLILNWRLQLQRYAKQDVKTEGILWSPDRSRLTYKGRELKMSNITQLYQYLLSECQKTFEQKLMLSCSAGFKRCAYLKDTIQSGPIGHSFITDRTNETYLSNTSMFLANCALQVASVDAVDAFTGRWSKPWVVKYEHAVSAFLHNMLLLVHISGGGPLRAPELLSVSWKNTSMHTRSLRIVDGKLMLHVSYHKSQAITHLPKPNVRFLTQEVADLLLNFLIYVQPFRSILCQHNNGLYTMPSRLWVNVDGSDYSKDFLFNQMKKACQALCISPLNPSAWRNIASAIVKCHFGMDADHFLNGGDADGETEDATSLALQANHSVITANKAYAGTEALGGLGLWESVVASGRRASKLWQEKFKFVMPHPSTEEAVEAEREAKRVRLCWTLKGLEEQLKIMYKDVLATWKSAEQANAVCKVVANTPEILIVIGTGGGKSMSFMLPASLPDAETTILVAPLNVLREEFMERSAQYGVPMVKFDSKTTPSLPMAGKIVVISVEEASSDCFIQYLFMLTERGQLDRIVIDEAHMILTTSSYRSAMADLVRLREVPAQFVYLSATMSESMRHHLETAHFLDKLQVIRGPCNRENIHYTIERHTTAKQEDFMEWAIAIIHRRVNWWCKADTDRCLIFTRTCEEAEKLSNLLGCSYIHSKSGSKEVKKCIMNQWVAVGKPRMLVGTTAIGAGVDCQHVRVVIHYKAPFSLVDFAQESGRAGRDGVKAGSVVLLPTAYGIQDNTGFLQTQEQRDLNQYLSLTVCLRKCLSDVFDSSLGLPSTRCQSNLLCSVCMKSQLAQPIIDKDTEVVRAPNNFATGPIRAKLHQQQSARALSQYSEGLSALTGRCVFCISQGLLTCVKDSYHCMNSTDWQALKQAQQTTWKFPPFTACFYCHQPQDIICQSYGDRNARGANCLYKNIVLPCTFLMFTHKHQVVQSHFGKKVSKCRTVEDFMLWSCQQASVFGHKSTNAVQVAELWLKTYASSLWDHTGAALEV